MLRRNQLYLLGFATLIGFPALGFAAWWFIESSNPFVLLNTPISQLWWIFPGVVLGFAYAALGMWLFSRPAFREEWERQSRFVFSMRLTVADSFFLSVCAGVGEELFFRACLQQWLGVWLTTLLFVAIHGYLNPRNIKLSLYGLLLLPFVLMLGFGYEYLGLWFAVAAHFAYDLWLFLKIRKIPEESGNDHQLPEEFNADNLPESRTPESDSSCVD